MRFSLKTFLIAVCVVGAVVGGSAKLLLENPEAFVSVYMVVTTVAPFLLAIATISILGIQRKNRPLVVWSVVLLFFPFFSMLMLRLLLPTGNPIQMLSTRRLIERRLTKQVEEPWVWQELNRRLANNSLAPDDAEDAIVLLTDHMKTTRPAGWNQPLPWQQGFIASAIQRKLVSKETWLNLADAFFGTQPVVKPIGPVIAGQRGVQVHVSYGSPWTSSTGIGIELMWDVKSVLLDGMPMKITNPNRFGETWDAYCEGPLKPGDHELKVELECAYGDSAVLSGPNASRFKVSPWPKAMKHWTTTATAPLKVSAPAGK